MFFFITRRMFFGKKKEVFEIFKNVHPAMPLHWFLGIILLGLLIKGIGYLLSLF